MIISSAVAVTLDEVCLRIDAVQHLPAIQRLVDSERERQEFEEYLGAPFDPLAPIADRRFAPIGGRRFLGGRYNTEDFPAFYLSRSQDSARAEVVHYNPPAKLKEALAVHGPIHLAVNEWHVTGSAEDLLPAVASEPRLTAHSWGFCQEVGADVRSRVDTVVAPSARLSGGVNLAIFRRHRVASVNLGPRLRLDLGEDDAVVFVD